MTRKLRKVTNVDQGESRKTLVEGTAESIQRAFTMCLTERSTNRNGIGKDGKPEGKKVGIYSFANLVLKLLFQVCRKPFNMMVTETNKSGSVIKHDWRTNSSRTYPSTLLLFPSTPPASVSPTSITSAASCSPITTSTAHSSAYKTHTTNVTLNV